MKQRRKAGLSRETFDDFLADQGLLEATENHALKELIAEGISHFVEWFRAYRQS